MNGDTNKMSRSVPRHSDSQRGQAIVIMAAVMIVLLAMLGLAIDGGGMFFLWRDLQNATDASALAASYARCTEGNDAAMIAAGLKAADENGFNNNGVDNTVTISNPPTIPELAGNPNYVQVTINAEKPSYFIHIVYKGPLEMNNTAVGFCIERFDPTTVPAIFAGSTTCGQAINFSGSRNNIDGGMHSNDNISITGNDLILDDGASMVGDFSPGNAYDKVTDPDGDPVDADPGVEVRTDPLTWLTMDKFQPGGEYAIVAPIYTVIGPGSSDPDWSNGTWRVNGTRVIEGLYYVDGNVVLGNKVTFGPRGATIATTGQITWGAKDANTYHYYEDLPLGLIMFTTATSSNCGDKVATMSGNGLDVTGVFYIPNGNIRSAFSSSFILGAIIAQNVDISGSDNTLIYDPTLLPPISPKVKIAD